MDQIAPRDPAGGQLLDPKSREFAESFTSFLLQGSYLDEFALRRAERAQRQSGERFDLVLLRLGLLQDEPMARLLAAYLGLRHVTAKDLPITPLLTSEIDAEFLKSSRVLPIAERPGGIVLAVADPFNHVAISAIGYLLDRKVEICVASDGDVQHALERLYGREPAGSGSLPSSASSDLDGASDADIVRLSDMASEAPIIRLVQDIITRAVNEQASDIHVEPREDAVEIRFRVDGILHSAETLPISVRAALGSRIKIMAHLNIAERRMPQDGRIKVNVRGHEIDLRVSTVPTLWGESIVLRILDRSSVELDFAKLGFSSDVQKELGNLLHLPNGIILVTGPTGSGKTTTLYAALSLLSTKERKVFTVEDPIEYQLAGVNQIQVQPKIGLTFATALRSILRQDPDIIMVGEIRDLETAQMAIQAALTGHLVLSTVHTNSATATLTRLLDMGVEKYLLASTMKGVLAQRLVRRICPFCSTLAPEDNPGILRLLLENDPRLGTAPPRPSSVRSPVGCANCRKTGFSGRTTIHELMTLRPELIDAVLDSKSENELEKVAITHGMTTMLQDGLIKVLDGVTTLQEVMRVTRYERCQDIDTEPTTTRAS